MVNVVNENELWERLGEISAELKGTREDVRSLRVDMRELSQKLSQFEILKARVYGVAIGAGALAGAFYPDLRTILAKVIQ
jgi:hypothetical protein